MEPRPSPRNRLDKVGTLRKIVLDHQARERLTIVIAADRAECEAANIVRGEIHLQAVRTVEEEAAVAVGVGIGAIETLTHHTEVVFRNAKAAIAAATGSAEGGAV